MRKSRKWLVMAAMSALIAMLAEDVASADTFSDEDRFVQLINSARAGSGLGGLSVDGSLVNSARAQSSRMAASGSIFHNSNLPNEFAGQNWASLGENVGMGSTVDDLHQAFMNSESHRANILGNYDRVGIGIVMSGSTYFVTQVFWKTQSTPTAGAASATPTKVCRRVRGRTRCTIRRKAPIRRNARRRRRR